MFPGFFEGDQDLDLVGDIEIEMKKDGLPEVELEAMLYNRRPADGIGNAIVALFRSRGDPETGYLKSDLKYKTILAVALLLCAGSNIDQQHIEHVKASTGEVESREGFAYPISDHGFRGPGKRQFLAALDAYQPGDCQRRHRKYHKKSCRDPDDSQGLPYVMMNV
ncbi:hypothetical protein PspLS_10098 [Pyricularia sp. CBS 133598]|nr:hypothetical protein PspLS_10098 [Pyricularia sp. CBS 133598]